MPRASRQLWLEIVLCIVYSVIHNYHLTWVNTSYPAYGILQVSEKSNGRHGTKLKHPSKWSKNLMKGRIAWTTVCEEWMIPFVTYTAAETLEAFQWDRQLRKNASSHWEISTPIYYMVPCANTSQHPKPHLNRFSRLCSAHQCDKQTDGHTERPRYSVFSNMAKQ